jgi:FtsH-binding integral membrane protein
MPTNENFSYAPTRGVAGLGTATRDRSRAVFGQVMGLVALTVGATALGAYIGRDLKSGGFIMFIGALGCIIGLNVATQKGREQLAITLLLGLGLLLGLFVGPVLNYYAKADPSALWQAAGSTALFTAGLGAYGYATRRDLSRLARTAFWSLLVLIVFGLVATFVVIPGAHIIYSVAGLVIFGAFTIIDFNRLAKADMQSAVPIAAGIFLDIFNVFLFFLSLFGGGGRR